MIGWPQIYSRLPSIHPQAFRPARSSPLPGFSPACDAKRMPPKPARVLGPYPNRDKWRLVVLDGNERKSLVVASEQAAQDLKAQLLGSEVLHRQVRDVDDGGQLLWVTPEAHRLKTRAARRRLAVPRMLQELLRETTRGKQPSDFLIAGDAGKPRSDSWLWHQVRVLCQQAGLPPICPHSLRGLNATLALEGGATAQAVAAALGHTHFAITARHYADKSAQSNARVRRVAEVLEKQGREADLLELAALLQQTLGAAQCAQLAARLLATSPSEDDPSRTNLH